MIHAPDTIAQRVRIEIGRDERDQRITVRSILLGCLLIPLNCYWVIAMEQVWKSGNPSTISLFFNAIFTLLALQAFNATLHRIAPSLALGRAELLTIYSMVCIGTGLASQDWIQVALPTWAHSIWHASPENNWQDLFMKDVPAWLIVTEKSALGPFYTGRSTFYQPYFIMAWLRPVLWWSLFFTVVQVVMLCENMILHRQWTEREKLSFPIAQVPLEMTRPDRWLWRQRSLWWGFGAGALLDFINGLHEFYPAVPRINVKMTNITPMLPSHPWGAMGFTPVSLFPFVIGIGYLLPLDLCFSAWFFYLFFKAQIVIGALFGWQGSMGYEGVQGTLPYVNEQGMGAYLALFAFAIWAARYHLKDVVRVALGIGSNMDNSSCIGDTRWYRMAFIGLTLALLFLLTFSIIIGMSLPLALAFFFIYFALCTVITKIRAELGPPVHDLHFAGPDRMLITWLGSTNLSKGNLIGMTLYFGFNRAYRAIPMPYQLEAFKMTDVLHADRARMAMALLVAAPIASLAASWAVLHWAYQMGLATTMTECNRFGGQGWQRLHSWLLSPWRPNPIATIAMGVGALFTTALMLLRLRLLWFPFHPLGYAISSNWAMNCVWFPLMIASFLKALVLRYAGATGYRTALPIAVGVILGEFTMGSLWSIYGLFIRRHTYAFWLF